MDKASFHLLVITILMEGIIKEPPCLQIWNKFLNLSFWFFFHQEKTKDME